MRISLVLFAVLLTLLISCSPKLNISKSDWQSTPITIDGSSKDWKLPMTFNDPETKLNYTVSNDGQNLYLFIETNEEATIAGITKNGFQIWIDTTGKQNHQVGILCPIPQRLDRKSDTRPKRNENTYYTGAPQYSPNGQASASATDDSTKEINAHRRFMERTKQMHVSGFKTVYDGLVNLPDTFGINIGISWNMKNYLLYEAVIPLKSFLRYPLLSSDSSRVIGITFNYTSIPKATNNGNGSGFRPSFGFGMGFGMGMMMDGGGGGMRGGGTPEPTPVTVWRPFHLTTIAK